MLKFTFTPRLPTYSAPLSPRPIFTDWIIAETVISESVDKTYGCICCLCFLIGTVGNVVSFLHFKSKKRDVSSVIYMFITATDIVISVSSLPVGISYLSRRQPGTLFGNEYSCVASYYMWMIAILLSVFLVLCLTVARTISLLRPFLKQRIRYLVISVTMYTLIMFAKVASAHSLDIMYVGFSSFLSRCDLKLRDRPPDKENESGFVASSVSFNMVYTVPLLVVVVSCVISVVVLTRRNRNVQQRELQQSRNRATVTILLFALLYGICSTPLVVHLLIISYCLITEDWGFYFYMYWFDENKFYVAFISSLLPAVNSAANPILYFWRMKPLREYTTAGIRKILRRPVAVINRQ